MKEIKKYDVMSRAVISCIISAIVGLLYALFFGAIVGMTSSLPEANMSRLGMSFGFGMIILFPIIFAVIGFIGGALGAFIYNLVAKWVGGIKIELVDLDNKYENQ